MKKPFDERDNDWEKIIREKRTTPTDCVGEFFASMLGIFWFIIVGVFYIIAPWVFFYIIIQIFNL